MRLVFDGLKKIKTSQFVDVLSNVNPMQINPQGLGFTEQSQKSSDKYFSFQNEMSEQANEKFKSNFKKVSPNINHPQVPQDKRELSLERQRNLEFVKKHLTKTNQIAVIQTDIKLPVAPILKLALFQLKESTIQNEVLRKQQYDQFMGELMREINDFFSKSEKVMTLRYLFQKDGPIIQNYLEINPEDIFIYVSHTVKQADIDKRAS